MNEAQIASRAGRTNGIGRTGDTEVQGNLAGWVVRYRPRVVIVRPILRIVVKFRNRVDFILRLDVAVLGRADVNTDAILRHGLKINATVAHGLSRAINRNRPGARAHPHFFAFLVFQRVIIADTGQGLPHVAHVKRLHT